MFISNRGGNGSRKLLLALSVVLSGVAAQANTIGQWSGNPANQVWASTGSFSNIYASVSAAGRTIENSTEAITAANLANDNVFIIANPTAAPTTAELTTLASWVQAGHVLLLFTSPNELGSVTIANKILAGVYPSSQTTNRLSMSGTTIGSNSGSVSGKLSGTDPAIGSLGTKSLGIWQAFTVLGGSNLALNGTPTAAFDIGKTLRVDTVSLGRVYVFGDRFDSNSNAGLVTAGAVNANLSLFLNLLAQETANGGGGGPTGAPEPATFALTGLVLAGVLAWHRRKSI